LNNFLKENKMDAEKKWKRYTRVGDIFVNMTKYRQLIQPIDTGCLQWTGPKHRQGYSMIGVLNEKGERKMTVAHRVAMRMKLGREIGTNEYVRHACGNLACVNPAHLYIRNDETTNEITIPEVSALAN
jgi:hypothetical protein